MNVLTHLFLPSYSSSFSYVCIIACTTNVSCAFPYDYFSLENLKDVLKCPCNYIYKSTVLNHKLKLVENIGTYQEHVTCIGDGTNTYKILVRKPERKRPSEGLRYKWEDNIKVYIQAGGCEWVCFVCVCVCVWPNSFQMRKEIGGM